MKQSTLPLISYADSIDLYKSWKPAKESNRSSEEIVDTILTELRGHIKALGYSEKRRLLHGTLNTLQPNRLSPNSMVLLDNLLQRELREKAITTTESLIGKRNRSVGDTAVTLWKGDITTLQIDAIVNAANNQMLGCFQPLHRCIDNAIHSAAGVQLRDDCHITMEKQGALEPTGTAKITRAYNLPSIFVLHSVGPIVQGAVTEQNRSDLASAYRSCLDHCVEIESIRSIAFCAISTGVFGYPVEEAAQVAVETVTEWLEEHRGVLDLVVFTVFSDRDEAVYKEVME